MKRKIILSADSTCDLGRELQEKHNVRYFNYHIQIGEKSYKDMEEITPDEIFEIWRTKGILPKTAAVTPLEYYNFFKNWVADGYDIVHLNLGAGLSSSHQNCMITASELGNVYPIDSANLSTGVGLLVLKASEMIKDGMTAAEIQKKITEIRVKSHASFVLDTLEFLKAGGRCNSLMAFGANLLNIKPGIEVDNQNGGCMGVGKKYRGAIDKVLPRYIHDKLAGRTDLDLEHVFIVHSGSPESDIELAKVEIEKHAAFKQIHITRANGTISSHCGPRTLGVMFMTK